MKLLYETRDGQGNDIVKEIEPKTVPLEDADFYCPGCARYCRHGAPIKKLVSSNFTDWNLTGPYVCENCMPLFSLYFYSYVKDPDGIRLLNVRQLKDALITPQKPPFMFVITTSQKKHLWYRAQLNHSPDRFAVQFEMETIWTTPERMRSLFEFVEGMLNNGCTKDMLRRGQTSMAVPLEYNRRLRHELETSREIQVAIHAAQKEEKQ